MLVQAASQAMVARDRNGGGRRLYGDRRRGAALLRDLGEDFLDAFVTTRTAAAGLGVVGHLLDRRQIVVANHLLDQHRIDRETLADHRAFGVVVAPDLAAKIGDGGMQRFAVIDVSYAHLA